MKNNIVNKIKQDKRKMLHSHLCINENPETIISIMDYYGIKYWESILSWSCCSCCLYCDFNLKSYRVEVYNGDDDIYLVLLEKNSKGNHKYHTIKGLEPFKGISAWTQVATWIYDRGNRNNNDKKKRLNSERD